MKNLILLLLLVSILASTANAQKVIDSEYLTTYDLAYFKEELEVPFSKFGTDLYRVLYTTTDLAGDLDTASALLVIPLTGNGHLPLLSYSHGTAGSRFDVPGYLSFEHVLPAIYASMGAVTVAADYLGLGYSKGIHPYVHADSEAWTSLDLIHAVKDFLPEIEIILNDQLFITGYSQGGHAAMALHRMIEQETDISVTGSVPMSGPYSISSGMRNLLLSDEEYTQVVYLAATAISYQAAYGTIYPEGDLYKFFKQPYADIIARMITEELSLTEANEQLISALITNDGGAFPKKMIFDEIVEAVLADDNHPINAALRDNDVYDWAPVADTRLFYCKADEQVSYINSIIARDTMIANGATQVSAQDLNSDFDHTECVTPAATNFVFYLSAFAQITHTQDVSTGRLVTYPNPSQGNIYLSLAGSHGQIDVQVWSMDGSLRHTINDHDPHAPIDLHHLERGSYLLSVREAHTDEYLGRTIVLISH